MAYERKMVYNDLELSISFAGANTPMPSGAPRLGAIFSEKS